MMTDEIPLSCVILTVIRAPLPTNVEVQLFQRAVAFDVVDRESPEFEKTLFSQAVFAVTKYICQQETVPEPGFLLCDEGANYDTMIRMFNVPGIVSCRPVEASDVDRQVIPIKVRL